MNFHNLNDPLFELKENKSEILILTYLNIFESSLVGGRVVPFSFSSCSLSES